MDNGEHNAERVYAMRSKVMPQDLAKLNESPMDIAKFKNLYTPFALTCAAVFICLALNFAVNAYYLFTDEPAKIYTSSFFFTILYLAFTFSCLACTILILIWIYRAAYNKSLIWIPSFRMKTRERLGMGKPMSPGWSVGYFFVPILCFYKPYIAMKQTWFASNKSTYNNPKYPDYFLMVWWILLLVEMISLKRMFNGIESPLTNPQTVLWKFAIINMPFAFSTIYMMYKITSVQEAQRLKSLKQIYFQNVRK